MTSLNGVIRFFAIFKIGFELFFFFCSFVVLKYSHYAHACTLLIGR
jgi:hypothetical protein